MRARKTRLPMSAAIAYSTITLAVVGFTFLGLALDGVYPFEDHTCRPCECEGSVLTKCAIPDALRIGILDLGDKEIADIAPGAFRSDALLSLDLANNHMNALSASMFESAKNLMTLDLSHNNISTIDEIPRKLQTLALRGNRLARMRSEVLSGGHLRNLLLDDNGMRQLDEGAFDRLPRLENLFMGGNEVNCSSVQVSLPNGARCIEAHCGVELLFYLGDGDCDVDFDPEYGKSRCAWDGGDCL